MDWAKRMIWWAVIEWPRQQHVYSCNSYRTCHEFQVLGTEEVPTRQLRHPHLSVAVADTAWLGSTLKLYESGQEWKVCACHWPRLCSPALFNQYTHPEYDVFILNKPACVIITHWCVQRGLRGCVNTFLQHSVTTKMDICARKWPPTFHFSIQSLPHIQLLMSSNHCPP